MRDTRKKIYYIAIISVFIIVSAAVVVRIVGRGHNDVSGDTAGETRIESNPLEIEVPPVSAEANVEYKDPERKTKTFTHPSYHFSVDYPDTLRVVSFDEGGQGETILFYHPTDPNTGFQVYVSPYNGKPPLTAKKIREMQPFTRVSEPQPVSIDGEQAVLFWSVSPEAGATREVWFVHNGFLYSVTTYANLDAWLSQIMATWRFTNG
jgi:hypothetical protein